MYKVNTQVFSGAMSCWPIVPEVRKDHSESQWLQQHHSLGLLGPEYEGTTLLWNNGELFGGQYSVTAQMTWIFSSTLITPQNREISIYVASSGVILFNDVIAAEILWMRRKLNMLKTVADISWPHNIQGYFQPI